MLRKKSIFIFLISVIFTFKINYLFAVGFPNLKLPFQKGESWGITTGYGGSSYHQNKNYYAIDFNLAGAVDLGKPILAAANGNVIFADWDTTGFGWCVIIDHGDKYKTLYAHFMEKPTVSGQVQQGQEIGKCGMSGGTSTGSHLHFALYFDNKACKPEPMSGYENFTEDKWYTSNNNLVFSMYSWDFNINYDLEGWTMTNIEKYAVQDGIFYINPADSDPYINSPDVAINSDSNDIIIVRMASNALDHKGAIYFTTNTSPDWDEYKKMDFYVHNNGKYYKYCIPMKFNSNWKNTITNFRIDPADEGISGDPSDTIGIDSISFTKLDWDFNIDFNTEGWTKTNIEILTTYNSALFIDPKQADPYITSPAIAKNANEYNYIFIRMSAGKACDGAGALYFTTSSSPNWSEDKKADFYVYTDQYSHNYFINMGNKWSWRDTITRIRIDPTNIGIADSDEDLIRIECIHIY